MNIANHNNYSDTELLEFYYTTQDSKWLGILLQRYTLLLFGTCMKYLKNENNAKDAVQQIFLKAINEIPKYKITYFKSWIYMVAKNHCLMQFRDKSNFTDIDNFNFANDDTIDFEELRQKDNDIYFMQQALTELNSEQRLCIDLFYLQKKSYQQIMEETSYDYMEVKSFIQNGKRNLKNLIEKKRKNGY